MPWISLNGTKHVLEELQRLSPESFKNEIEKSAVIFCQSWLRGQQEFTLQTSGSTGRPKSISVTRSQMEASARQTISALQLQRGETSLVCLDTKYIAGQMMLVRSLVVGMNCVVVPPSANPLAEIKSAEIDFAALVPYQLENIVTYSPAQLDRVRCAIIGGASVSNSLKEKIKKSACRLYATYGMTETLSHIALQKLNGADSQDYFEAFENIGLRMDDRGCLCIQASYLVEEIITNDLVEIIEPTRFRWLGRADHVINSGGVKVIPEKIERVMEMVLASLQIDRRLFVAGIPDEKLGTKVTTVIEGPPFDLTTQQEIIAKAGRQLTKYELPKELEFLLQFSETPTGKINRAATLAALKGP